MSRSRPGSSCWPSLPSKLEGISEPCSRVGVVDTHAGAAPRIVSVTVVSFNSYASVLHSAKSAVTLWKLSQSKSTATAGRCNFPLNWRLVMSPSSALTSEVFRIFALLTTGLLVAGGAIIAIVRFGFARDVSRAWDAYRGWLGMIPLIAASLFAGRAAVICFFAIIAIVAFTEYARATGLHHDLTMTFTSLAGIVAVAVVA